MIRILSFLFYPEVQQHNLGWFLLDLLYKDPKEPVDCHDTNIVHQHIYMDFCWLFPPSDLIQVQYDLFP